MSDRKTHRAEIFEIKQFRSKEHGSYQERRATMIAVGCDHAGFALKNELIRHLNDRGFETEDMGTYSEESCDYPEYARKVSYAVVSGKAEKGLLVCGTGIGMCIAANKVKGIRAAVASDEFSVRATREHNDANILCLGARVVDTEQAVKLLDIFLDTPFSEGANHVRRISKLED